MPSLGVVVCGYTTERLPDISRALQSLHAQTTVPAEIVFVSDHNPQLLAEVRARHPEVLAVANEHERGLSGARNTGLARVRSEIVAFLDDDAFADDDWAAYLVAAYAPDGADPVIGVGGSVTPNWLVPRPGWLPDSFLWVVGCSYDGQPTGRARIRNPIGANMSFRRDVFERIGGFDPSVGRIGKDAAGCEETEFSIRAAAAFPDSAVLLEPRARCHHTVPAERCTKGYFRRRCAAEGRSKAVVSARSGAGPALASERSYVLRTLPSAVLRGVVDLARGDLSGGSRVASIVTGLTVTTWTYAFTRARLRLSKRRITRAARPRD